MSYSLRIFNVVYTSQHNTSGNLHARYNPLYFTYVKVGSPRGLADGSVGFSSRVSAHPYGAIS